MTTINLKDFFYWYILDEPIEVSDEVAAVLRSDKRYEERHYERQKRNKAQYSLDAGDGIENHVVEFEPSAQELLERKERFVRLCHALNSLNDTQGRRIDAHIPSVCIIFVWVQSVGGFPFVRHAVIVRIGNLWQ